MELITNCMKGVLIHPHPPCLASHRLNIKSHDKDALMFSLSKVKASQCYNCYIVS